MSTTKQRLILLLLNDGSKVEGLLIKIDKENFKMILEKATLIKEGQDDQKYEKIEVYKKDIKEIRVLEEKEIPKEEVKEEQSNQVKNNKNPLKDDKINGDSAGFGEIPLNIKQQYQKDGSKYEKNGFFDNLTISNNKENFKEVKTYNEKNKDTFGVVDDFKVSYHKKRGGYKGHSQNQSGHHHTQKHYSRGGHGYGYSHGNNGSYGSNAYSRGGGRGGNRGTGYSSRGGEYYGNEN